MAAFSEFASKCWEESDWKAFGRGTGTSDILNRHPRLYRSLGFGDPDYPDAVAAVVPVVLSEATGPKMDEKMGLVAEYVPNLVGWISENATHRTKKRFFTFVQHHFDALPEEWAAAAAAWDFSPSESPSRPSRFTPTTVTAPAPSQHDSPGASGVKSWPLPAVAQLANAMPSAVEKKETDMDGMDAPQRIFIVHGHDTGAVNDVKIWVHRWTGIMPEILADQPGRGDTIIEKFEREANQSNYAIVLLTPDDEGRVRGTDEVLQARARQNVILELGYFFGKLGREKVAVLNGGVEQPSDVHGLNYISYGKGAWTEELRAELRHAGFTLT